MKISSMASRATALGLVAAFTVPAVMAQQAAPDQQLEKIEVTGSLLPRIEGEAALPVQVISHADIERSGATTVEELLGKVMAATSGLNTVVASGSGATTSGLSGLSLRGLGSNRTLVLINGRRIAPYGNVSDSVSVDVNSIPLSAIERVEVLKDGASAIYGSEAVAGVINFIMKKDYNGVELNAEHGITKDGGGADTKASFTVGFGDFATDRFNVVAVGTYDKQASLVGAQRSFANSAINVVNGNDTTSGNTFPGNVAVPVLQSDGTYAQVTVNPASVANGGNCAPSVSDPLNHPTSRCRFDTGPYVTLVAPQERYNLFLRRSPSVGLPVILSVARQESAFNPSAHSGVGAKGLMQMISPTARTAAQHAGVAYDEARLSKTRPSTPSSAPITSANCWPNTRVPISSPSRPTTPAAAGAQWIDAYGDPRVRRSIRWTGSSGFRFPRRAIMFSGSWKT